MCVSEQYVDAGTMIFNCRKGAPKTKLLINSNDQNYNVTSYLRLTEKKTTCNKEPRRYDTKTTTVRLLIYDVLRTENERERGWSCSNIILKAHQSIYKM